MHLPLLLHITLCFSFFLKHEFTTAISIQYLGNAHWQHSTSCLRFPTSNLWSTLHTDNTIHMVFQDYLYSLFSFSLTYFLNHLFLCLWPTQFLITPCWKTAPEVVVNPNQFGMEISSFMSYMFHLAKILHCMPFLTQSSPFISVDHPGP